ncbi:MAG: FHA domain-containing protein [Deltaproteobacteria bacterium]|nr:FHA domain-containing protein [Deltaproteobacteria bacterium]
MIRLLIEDDEGGITTVPIEKTEIDIGREQGNYVRLTERNVSRRHARVILDGDAYFIEDQDSYNGVRVNGERITRRVRVLPGDIMQIGDYRLSIQVEKQAPPPLNMPQQPGLETAAGQQETSGEASLQHDNTPPPEIPPPPLTPPADLPPPAVPDTTAPRESEGSVKPQYDANIPAGDSSRNRAETAERQEASDKDISTVDTAVIRYQAKQNKPEEGEPRVYPGMPDPPARLVCLSPPFEGLDISLNKPEILIGRDESCQVCLDHRSVEGRHAKVAFQEGTFSVIDLGTESGIQVNDETYRMVTLRKGDILAIGSLRFRFVAPGENFNFVPGIEEAEKFVELAASRRLGKPVIAGLVSGLLVLLVIILFVTSGGEKNSATGASSNKSVNTGEKAVKTEKPGIDTKQNDYKKDLERGREAFRSENWTLAMASFKSVLEKNPGNEEARSLLDKAANEQKFAARYDECRDLFNAGKYARAFETCKQIPETSRYAERSQKLIPEIRRGFIQKHLKSARESLKKKRFADAREELKQVAIFDPENSEAIKIKNIMKNRGKAKSSRTSQKGGQGSKKYHTAKALSPREQAKKIYLEATKKHLANQLERAIKLYKKALKVDPKFAYAYRGLGSAFASLGNGKMACKMYKRYLELAPGAPDRNQVKDIIKGCK